MEKKIRVRFNGGREGMLLDVRGRFKKLTIKKT